MGETIWAIPGFLGLPTDWDCLQWEGIIGVDWQAFHWTSLFGWASEFNEWVARQGKKTNILMGYSFGGRLALHALIQRPVQWQAAIIISAHFGLADDQNRKKRMQQDERWAKRFEKEPWTDLMCAWNQQEVFAHDPFHFDRQEKDYQRSQLIQALLEGSLGKQMNLHEQIASLSIPILWMTGGKDERYCQIAQSLTFSHPNSLWKTIPHAGHRVPWGEPTLFSEAVHTFLLNLPSGV